MGGEPNLDLHEKTTVFPLLRAARALNAKGLEILLKGRHFFCACMNWSDVPYA
jgi:hypothetical protein